MITKLEASYAKVIEEIAVLQTRLKEAQIKKSILEEAGAAPVSSPSPVAQNPAKPKERRAKGKRAPKGFLSDQIVSVLEKASGLDNALLIEALRNGGYTWTLNTVHLSRELGKLVKEGRIAVERSGNRFTYGLPKASPMSA